MLKLIIETLMMMVTVFYTIDELDVDGDDDPINDNCDEDEFPDYLDFTSCEIVPERIFSKWRWCK